MLAWKVIAPVMLPSASASLPRRTHSTLLAFSGISVASGASTSESTSAEIPAASAIASMPLTNSSAPPMIAASETTNWATIWNVLGGSSRLVSK